jgi:hypothetical protein
MGSYSVLKFGHFALGEWKSHVPLQPLLLFTQEDYHQEPANKRRDWPIYRFTVPASVARRRADARGLTLAACQRLFLDFRADSFWHFSAKSGREWRTVNEMTFEQYLSACERVFKKCDNLYSLARDAKVNRTIRRAFSEEFFTDDTEYYFYDGHFCMMMRAFLEVVPPRCDVLLDISDLVAGGYLELDDVPHIYDYFMETMLQRIGLDYQLYGFAVEENPSVDRRLRARIGDLSENRFIDHLLLPLFGRMGFQRVRKVRCHGPNEFGSDILPFRYVTPLGTLEYYALQAKAVPIHGRSAKQGNAGELISQATQAFSVAFVDDLDNERKRIDKFVIATNKMITPAARHTIESSVEGKRAIVFLDIDSIVALVRRLRLVQYLLFTPFD